MVSLTLTLLLKAVVKYNNVTCTLKEHFKGVTMCDLFDCLLTFSISNIQLDNTIAAIVF